MKKSGRVRKGLSAALLTAAFALGVFTQPAAALTSGDITGVDNYYGTGEVGKTIDVLAVTGNEGDTVFVEMLEDGKVIASHLAFTLGADAAQAEGGSYVGAVSVTIDNYDPAKSYTIRVYADREQTQPLYEGTVSAVYAQLDGGQRRILALRTIGSESRAFNAPASVSFGNATYRLSGAQPVSEAPLTYAYTLASEAESIDGSITYVDDEGNVLLTTPIEGIAKGTTRKVPVPSVITVGEGADASYWRTVCFGGAVEAGYPGTSDFTISCKSLGGPAGNAGGFYNATIRYVDGQGNVLLTDSVSVTGTYRYTPPTQLSKRSGKAYETYGLAAGQGPLVLSPSDEVEGGSATYDVVYDRAADGAPARWTVVLENGSVDPKAAGRRIGTEVIEVKPGETARYVPKASIEAGGETLVPVTTTLPEYSYEYGSGAEPVLTVYYVPEGWQPKDPYDITVRYVNIATGEVLQERTLTSRFQDRDFLEIASPEGFTQGGVEYVRLAGQEESLWHDYYSSTRAYTIYYRDVNDDLSAHITISRTRVVYEGTTTTTTATVEEGAPAPEGGAPAAADSTAPAGADGTAAADAAAAGVATLTIPDDATPLAVIEGDGTSTVVDGEGRDLNTVRIEDDETPLASLKPDGADDVAAAIKKNGVVIAGVGAGIAVACLLFFVFFKRRKKDGETEDEA